MGVGDGRKHARQSRTTCIRLAEATRQASLCPVFYGILRNELRQGMGSGSRVDSIWEAVLFMAMILENRLYLCQEEMTVF